ncbi:tetratricopeptide repeat-containing glycosyltransferase family protein [Caulobacter hibisci]|uniref:Tetratricopeptide repeat protein n=1 Tax=Caulobacter hibisci TaxID=2035993 RepID=A0ABS0SVB4_9CAUL|nr:tetratricopeptide repeat protein [Caulobacter hibisci]MBI1682618.1 tetratricopeptide repeat protein [Caulobacter hibisci]
MPPAKLRPSAATTLVSPMQRIADRIDEVSPAPRQLMIAASSDLAAGDFQAAERKAMAAAPQGGPLALRLLGFIYERWGQLPKAFTAYQAAHKLWPDDVDGVRDLARLARRLGQPALAADLLTRVRVAAPGDLADAQDLASTLRDLDRFDDALRVVREAMVLAPEDPNLWSLLGSIATQRGDDEDAKVFHDEAARLGPREIPVLANAAIARLDVGDAAGALAACDAALAASPSQPQAASIRMTRAFAQLCLGDIAGGWADYAARLLPERREAMAFDIAGARWTPERPLRGLSLLLVGEQGLGDEVMFGSLLPDLLSALGPSGRLALAVEPRLVSLFARGFPGVRVIPHTSTSLAGRTTRSAPEAGACDAWAPMGALLPLLRPSADRFAPRAFLSPDPDRLAHWRDWLASLGPGRKVGVMWRSRLMNGLRNRRFAPFETWTPVLRTPGAVFVNLQYGGPEPELAKAAAMGLDIRTPPGLDLMQDLEGVAALTCALDMVISPMTATSNIAAACGVETWIIASNPPWPMLGTGGYPWYPNVRAFAPEGADDWGPRLEEVAGALAERLDGKPLSL